MFKALSLSYILLLGGCGAIPRVELKEVAVSVPVMCRFELPDKPIEYSSKVNPQTPFLEKANAFYAENEERKVYEAKLEAAIKKCHSE